MMQQKQSDLPNSYLLIQFNQVMSISQIQADSTKVLVSSPLSQTLFFTIVKEVINRQNPDLLQSSMQNIINFIFDKGDSQKADLLVQDIFGADNCAIIGLPAKLIAASLGKYAKQEQVTSTSWDQLSSLLNALAINTGLMGREWNLITNINKFVLKTSVSWPNRMLQTVRTLLGGEADIYVSSKEKPQLRVLPKIMLW